jgi:hypothetical protein
MLKDNIGKSNNMAIEVSRYKRMKQRDLSEFKQVTIKTFAPNPTDFDYKRGYIVRYFAQKANDLNYPIFEISDFTFNILLDNPFYTVVQLNWRISGSYEEIKESNFKSVKLVSKNMPNLMMYLPNYLQFSK